MKNRCILIFPDFPNISIIEGVRAKYDPAARLVEPHITLVFPFVSDIGTVELREHIRSALADIEPFRISLQGITEQKGFDSYLLLNVHQVKNTIKELHQRLYSGLLEPYRPHWSRNFEPHMTVGKLTDTPLYTQAVKDTQGMCDVFTTCVEEISVEIIGPDESSEIEFKVKLPVE
jgi:2'-5' RNA ligase